MKEYKRCLAIIRTYLNDKALKLNSKKLDKIISEELEKPIDEMDTHLIDLCLLLCHDGWCAYYHKQNYHHAFQKTVSFHGSSCLIGY